jgi:hypothetical protein
MRLEKPCGSRNPAARETLRLEKPCGSRNPAARETLRLEKPCGSRLTALLVLSSVSFTRSLTIEPRRATVFETWDAGTHVVEGRGVDGVDH